MAEVGRFIKTFAIESWLEVMHYRERVTNADEVLLTKGRRVLVSRKESRFQVLQSALSRKAEGVEASAIRGPNEQP